VVQGGRGGACRQGAQGSGAPACGGRRALAPRRRLHEVRGQAVLSRRAGQGPRSSPGRRERGPRNRSPASPGRAPAR
jgi:hypothetical protein